MLTFFAWDGGWFGLIIAALIVGLVGGFFGARALLKRELEKNPPISKEQIRAMYRAMGKKPSESDILRVMNSMKKNTNI